MTLNEIKTMFQPGQQWTGKRSPGFKGEPSTVTQRTVKDLLTAQMTWSLAGDGRPYWMDYPRARDVIEARPGYLRFHVTTRKGVRIGAEVELTQGGAQ